MTLLTAIQAVCQHPSVGQPLPGAVVGSSDLMMQEMQALVLQEANELRLRHDWSGLKTPAAFTLGALGTFNVISANLPADFRRLVEDSNLFSVELRRPCLGPQPSSAWLEMTRTFGPVASVFWRRLGLTLEFLGAAPGWTIAYEYVSSYPWANAAGVAKPAPTLDTDTLRVPEELVILGVIWRLRAAKGLDYTQEMATYENQILNFVSDDNVLLTPISLVGRNSVGLSQLPFTIVAS